MSLYKNQIHFVLGSSSPRRKDLLKQIGIVPDSTISPKIDETLLKKELPLEYLKRVTNNKMIFVKEKYILHKKEEGGKGKHRNMKTD